MTITLRSRESLCLDLDNAYRKIETLEAVRAKAYIMVEDVKTQIESITKDWNEERTVFIKQLAECVITAKNRKERLHMLEAELYELKNRRD